MLEAASVATILVLIYALVGAALVIISALGLSDVHYTFNEYLNSMAIATGGLAIGRGLAARKK